MKGETDVTVFELKRLLTELKEHRPDICIRYRLIGHMWESDFAHLVRITNKGVILSDESSRKLVSIADLSSIMQFELDKAFQSFQPHYHYTVVTSGDWR